MKKEKQNKFKDPFFAFIKRHMELMECVVKLGKIKRQKYKKGIDMKFYSKINIFQETRNAELEIVSLYREGDMTESVESIDVYVENSVVENYIEFRGWSYDKSIEGYRMRTILVDKNKVRRIEITDIEEGYSPWAEKKEDKSDKNPIISGEES